MNTLRCFGWMIAGLAMGLVSWPMSAHAQSDWTPGNYMMQAVGEMLDASDLLQRKMKLGYAEGVSMVGVLLEPNERFTITRDFQAGVRYAVVAGGDVDVKDLDVRILDASGNEIVKDTAEDRMGAIDWTPRVTAQYSIELHLYDAHRKSFCAFTVLRNGGKNVKSRVALDAAIGFFQDCQTMVDNAASRESTVGFHAGPGQAALFGVMLSPEEHITISGIVPQEGSSIFLGRGHKETLDIDLFVTSDGVEVGRDILDDSYPRYEGNFDGRAKHELKLENRSTSENAFVMAGILRVE